MKQMGRVPKAQKKAPATPPMTPAEFVERFSPSVRKWFNGEAEIDFSWMDAAIVIHDMRLPAKIRRGVLFTCEEIASGVASRDGEPEFRARGFMAKGG